MATQDNMQFNVYKHNELLSKLLIKRNGMTKLQIDLGLSIVQELCWTQSREKLTKTWIDQYYQPESQYTQFSLLQYNMRNFYSNQSDLLSIISEFHSSVVSLNELGTVIPLKTVQKTLFSYNVYLKEGSNTHGGAVLATDKTLHAVPLNIDTPNVVAALVSCKEKTFTIASFYSPPDEPIPKDALTSLMRFSNNLIIVGDFNAKHSNWQCPTINTKGRRLSEWPDGKNLEIHNSGMKTSLRSDTTIDLIISSENPPFVDCHTLPYTGSDHLPVLASFVGISCSDETIYVPKTYWEIYQIILSLIHDSIEDDRSKMDPFKWFEQFQTFLHGLKVRTTIWHKAKRKRSTIPPSLKLLIKHKHHLQNKYRRSKLEEDRTRLRSWCKLIQHELKLVKQRK
ncbi:unnamed protein product [Didymodactylos carnosus]|uniref:Endonuclease/exonuclease/phosphatase domain-containing protein n=1 Tax=Didymodactylos carnosus TaxID=1234261 RepID=A0A815P2M7_9BILA|nr:unnamed protein product [Didymodactylos carnosus]CAF1443312.1 unnamed protein product [Didymodactylos carnosus]CAF3809776.1 unnamed protein product [Didymodactylos carnosus]CAF4318730.1 unnamed protein product [Didymodactylos carnosus]